MENIYWMLCELSFHSYIPKRLEKGMMFLYSKNGEPYVFLMEKLPPNEEQWLQEYGYPVEPYIVKIDEVTDIETVLVEPDEIGWMDEGDFTDELVDIECRHFNRILSGYGGQLLLEMIEESEDELYPTLSEGKVTIRYPDDDDEEEEE